MKNNACPRFLPVLLATLFVFAPGSGSSAPPLVSPDLVPLVKSLKPVVVNISTAQGTNNKNADEGDDEETDPSRPNNPKGSPPPGMRDFSFKGTPFEEFFKRFFDRLPDQGFKSRSLGSGVIINSTGFILTNNHVVENASEILVRLSNDEEYTAEVVGKDAKTDLALIRIRAPHPLPEASLGDSEKSEVGSWVLAIGNPFGLEATVTVGIISAKGRVIGTGPYDDFIQTDAAINPGNSGGPLFNLEGQVIGINTAIFSRSGGNMGIGFAIPVNLAKQIVDQLKSHGRVTRGWLGVRIQTITQDLADALGLDKRHGALVASVDPGGPADKAGLKARDVIVSFDNHPVDRMHELPTIVAAAPVGKKVDVEIVRDGSRKKLSVTISEMKEETVVSTASPHTDKGPLGLTVSAITPKLRQDLDIAEDMEGIVITAVKPGSSAYAVGLRPGDVISEINRNKIHNLNEYQRLTKGLKKGDMLLILVMREGDPRFLAMKVD
ncbi:MAG: DegQ family serine endoprotease [Magnetococcus sp. DMHC-1]|nr:DegQ family serine endoprotease [Magnetococcales bacterium]